MLEVVLNLAYVISSVLGGWVGGWIKVEIRLSQPQLKLELS